MKGTTRILMALAILALALVPLFAGSASAAEPGNIHFTRTWQRTDYPVAELLVSRTWMWGPEGRTGLMTEEYLEAPDSQRTVQYFDKSRMEITHPDGDPDSIWYVTNGLLVVELITGQMQIGDNLFEEREPATAPVAGDGNDRNGPTYETFGSLLDAPARPVGEAYVERVSRSGQVTVDPSLGGRNITAAHLDEITGHTIAAPFWSFMNSRGTVYEDRQYIEALMFGSPVFATGRPITEAYWAEVLIAGTPADVLMQCFERRCLTYNPSNPEGWQVEAGNVGIHYYEWRYGGDQNPPGGNLPPGNPPPGDPPPSDPPPGDPPPGDPPPPGSPPPGNPPANAPDAPANVDAMTWGVPGENDFDPPVGGILIEWYDQSNDETGFKIYRYRAGGDAQLLGGVGADVNSYFAPHPDEDGRWCFFVVSYNDDGASAPSNYDCAYAPRAPQFVGPNDGYVSTDRVVTFRWNALEDAKSYSFCLFYPNHPDAECGGGVLNGSGDEWFIDGGHVEDLEVSVGAHLAPDGVLTSMEWTVAACFGGRSGIYCVEQENRRDVGFDLRTVALQLISPEDGYTAYGREIEFQWTPVADVQGYVVCLFYANDANHFCDFNAPFDAGSIWWTSGPGIADGIITLEIPDNIAPDGAVTEFYWTVSACFTDAYTDCVEAHQRWGLTVDLRQDIQPPLLDRSEVDPNDPGRFTFYWHLSEGAERNVLCVAEPGANCEFETGAYYKSSVLGATVDVYPMDIPLWLAPDGQVTNLRWTVAACDADLNCVWQPNDLPIVVDRTPQLSAPNLLSPADEYTTDSNRVELIWDPVPGAASYRVCLAYVPGARCPGNDTNMSAFLDPGNPVYVVWTQDRVLKEYEWSVAACDANGDCVWQTQYRSLTIDRQLDTPNLISPNNRYQTADRRIVFEWDGVADAERYIVCAYVSGGNCENNTGTEYKSGVLGEGVRSYPLTIPAHLAPDDTTTDVWWTVAACDANLNCVWQPAGRWIILSPDMEAPRLVGPNGGYETTERRVEFEWDLAPDATSYIICIAEPGANCRNDTGNVYKSSVLGPAVTTYPVDIPYWLAPDNERTQVNWVVGACYSNGHCVWQVADRSIFVDLH